MKFPHPSILLIAFALGACAPSATTTVAPVTPAPPATQSAGNVAPPPTPPPPDLTAPVESVPDDWWLLDPAIDHLRGISVERAYSELLAGRQPRRTVVVAILDSGIDAAHEDLDDVLWVNEDEIPGNGIDDDGNGYVDDVHGWNFLGGADGRNVHQDTYEVTRLYVECRDAGQLETPRCAAIEDDLEGRRAEASSYLQQYRSIAQTQNQIMTILRQHIGVDTLTREAVAAIQTSAVDVRQAQQLYLQMVDAGATPEAIQEGIEALTNQLEYAYNPDFDPRSIVGDNYENATDRIYGNNDVRGPGADHGTHVAGIVAAERGNGLGMNGVATGVRVMSVRTVPDGDERDKDVANAIRYAVDNGAHIINMSFGKGYSPEKPVVDEAVRYAESRGVLMVHAAGNDGADLASHESYPSPYFVDGGEAELWLEIGASGWNGSNGLVAPFSNYGSERVDVFAPGVDIYSAVPDDEYAANSGTSMAAPVVSGLAALIMAYYPELTTAQVKQIILDSATRYTNEMVLVPGGNGQRRPFGELSATGAVVNAHEALRRAAEVAGASRN